jgi:hypothetical protein
MGITVTCPNGHEFKVKDKYAGKKGLCPYCKDQVPVRVPDAVSSEQLQKTARRIAAEQHGSAASAAAGATVFDETLQQDASSSGSLLSSSVIRHNVKCKCGQSVPMWYARCPKCGEFMPQR